MFVDESSNPYAAPRERSAPGPANRPVAALLCLALWAPLAGGVWVGRARLLPIFQDFDAALPAISQLVLNPLYAPGIMLVGVAFAAAIYAVRNSTYYRRLRIVSIVAMGVLALLSAYALFWPLVVLIDALR
jgi:hypothetical protein